LQIPIVFLISVAGEVVPDGVNIKNLKLESLRRKIGLVTQEPALLSLSIRDNIAYGHNASSDEIEEAAKGAHAHTFISSLEKGYETQVEIWKMHMLSSSSFIDIMSRLVIIIST